MAAGLIVSPFCNNLFAMLMFFGIILPTGTGALCFGIVMGALAPIIGEKRAAAASGIVQASAGIGDALMSPLLQRVTDNCGVTVSMPAFAAPILLMLPVVIWIGIKRRKISAQQSEKTGYTEKSENESLAPILKSSFRDRTYWYLLIGFSTCGFHMSIIETHLFSQYIENGIPNDIASLTLTVYGIFTMLGAVITGFLGQRFRMKNVLACVYGIRVLIALIYYNVYKDAGTIFVK